MATAAPAEFQTRRFTADEFWQLCDAGILRHDERLELIDGDITVVSPSGWDHAWVVEELGRRLGLAFGEGFVVRMQSIVGGTEQYLPEPDIAVRPASGPWLTERRHPRVDEFLIVVEVAATSQHLDRRKVRLYAEAGAPVYWIVDVPARTVTVHTGPNPDGTWVSTEVVAETGVLTPPGTDAAIPVSAILTPPEPAG